MPAEGTTAQVAGIIPARWESSRFPGKPLHKLVGKSLIGHVIERVSACQNLDRILVATDDQRIRAEARACGADVVITSPHHPTGTDRIAEVVGSLTEIQHVVNIQGDEPLVSPVLIDLFAETLKKEPEIEMITAANPVKDLAVLNDPNIVKVVLDSKGDALYFSRSPIPFYRGQNNPFSPLRHMGLYGYQSSFLRRFVEWPEGALEKSEGLEQLRALENGTRIRVLITSHESIGLDTPEQVPEIEALLTGSNSGEHPQPITNQAE